MATDRARGHIRFSNRPLRVKRFQTIHGYSVDVAHGLVLLFSNRPLRVKRFQTIHAYMIDVAHGLVLLFGIGTKALPSWHSRTTRNHPWVSVALRRTVGSAVPANYAD